MLPKNQIIPAVAEVYVKLGSRLIAYMFGSLAVNSAGEDASSPLHYIIHQKNPLGQDKNLLHPLQ